MTDRSDADGWLATPNHNHNNYNGWLKKMTKKEVDEMDGWLRSRGLFMYVRIATYLPALPAYLLVV